MPEARLVPRFLFSRNLAPILLRRAQLYLGPGSYGEEIHALLDWKRKEISDAGGSVRLLADEEELIRLTARAVGDGKIVGWFQGRMEWGPHPLGNRSIIADPRRIDAKEILEKKLWPFDVLRPVSISILREAMSEWFEQEDDAPFMMKAFQVRSKREEIIPAAVHVDGSARVQTVDKRRIRVSTD